MFSRTCHVFRASVGAQQEALGAGLCDRVECTPNFGPMLC